MHFHFLLPVVESIRMSDGLIGGLVGGGVTLLIGLVGSLVFFGRKFEQIDGLKEDQKKQQGKIEEFDREISALKEFKANVQKFMDDKIYKSKSPLSLTDFGQKLIEESGFDKVFEEEKDNLVQKLEAKNPTTQYDVQEMARLLMSELTDYAPFEVIKTYAFEHGKDFAQILRAGAIPLRDYYLEQHKEITS